MFALYNLMLFGGWTHFTNQGFSRQDAVRVFGADDGKGLLFVIYRRVLLSFIMMGFLTTAKRMALGIHISKLLVCKYESILGSLVWITVLTKRSFL